ncbi:MAG: tetratricopeptide repeat protein [Candidatus Mcinerneyibacterium aminivorans]|uniref:Tetratricopeptide repeat protein n=1 Tax=Candidatus Mcinerneyibacterium aminivorans TaxID=2703815 RepID=A0A5D0MGJ5_9BACT|nr:MAG: tetratricopeptide repeat protein [Candidatus Mcinerneyibacterium aminivorans]
MKKVLSTVLIIFLAIIVVGCGAKTRKQQAVTDTPQFHYNEGMKYIESEEYNKAFNEFQLATSLDPNYAPAYEGMAYAYLGENNLEEALRAAKTSLDKDSKYIDGYIVLAKVYMQMKDYKKALKNYEKAYKLDNNSIKASRNIGYSFFKMGEYQKAREWYNKAFSIKENDKVTMNYLDELNDMQKAMAGMGSVARKIAKQNIVTRADVAALFINELNIEEYFKEKENYSEFKEYSEKKEKEDEIEISDVDKNHWAISFINKAVKYGIIDLATDNKFYPKKPITKANYAVFISRVIMKVEDDDSLGTRYIGSPSPFKDVPNSHYAFNGIMICTNRGILQPEISGRFGLNNEVPGRNAVIAIKKLKNLIEDK